MCHSHCIIGAGSVPSHVQKVGGAGIHKDGYDIDGVRDGNNHSTMVFCLLSRLWRTMERGRAKDWARGRDNYIHTSRRRQRRVRVRAGGTHGAPQIQHEVHVVIGHARNVG